MPSQKFKPCPHFQLHSEQLALGGPPAYLAIRHCLLTERMLRLLESIPEAHPLAQRLTIRTLDGRAYAFVGPDLEAVTQFACTHGRCHQQCTPAYKQMLEYFDMVDPDEDSVTCEEGSDTKSDRETAESETASSSCP